MTARPYFDIAIIGGGMSGMMAALLFSIKGVKIGLFEPGGLQKYHENAKKISPRTITIALEQVKKLKEFGIWNKDLESISGKIEHIEILEEKMQNSLVFSAKEVDEEAMGFVVDYWKFLANLASQISASNNIKLIEQKVSEIENGDERVSVVAEKESFDAGLVFVASGGRKNDLVTNLGFSFKSSDYWQNALVFVVKHDQPHRNIAVEEFSLNGPFALLPTVKDRESSIVWSMPRDRSEYIAGNKDLLEEMTKNMLKSSLGNVKIISEIAIHPLSLQLANKPVSGKVCLIGDALHRFHPVAGQGFNLILKDLFAIINLLENDILNYNNEDFINSLKLCLKARKWDNLSVGFFCHSLIRLFDIKSTLVQTSLRLAIFSCQQSDTLKRKMILHAIGR